MTIHQKPDTPRGRPRVAGLFATLFGVAIVAAACSGSYGGGAASASATPPASMPPAASPATGASAPLGTADSALGTILVDSKGDTLYAFAKDGNGTSVCDGECANDWPPLAAPASLPASLPGVTGEVGMTTREDGTKQLTVAGHPLYRFEGDSAPGQTNGQGVVLNGGVWNVVSAAGAPIADAKAGPATSAPAGGSSY
jgi:predicted lipoprotein with Yx(FWY)xxD motif